MALSPIEQTLRDLRYGIAQPAEEPGLFRPRRAVAGFGVMATTVIYSVLHAVVLDPFPYRDVDRLSSVRVTGETQRGCRTYYSVDQFLEIADRSTIFDGVIASTISDVLWVGEGDPQRLRGNHGTFNTFDVMGVPPLIGRTPTLKTPRRAPRRSSCSATGSGSGSSAATLACWGASCGSTTSIANGDRRDAEALHVARRRRVSAPRFHARAGDRGCPAGPPAGAAEAGCHAGAGEADLRPIIADLKKREPDQFPDKWRVGVLPFTETFPAASPGTSGFCSARSRSCS